MRRIILLLVNILIPIFFILFFSLDGLAQYTNVNGLPIAYWDFEQNTTRTNSETTVEQAINPNCSFIGKNGGATSTVCQYAGRGTGYGGTATGSAIVAGGWSTATTAGTTFFEFKINTTGFSGISIVWDCASLGTNLTYPFCAISISTDGGVTYGPYSGNFISARNTWLSISSAASAAADNNPDVRIRFSGYYSNNSANCTSNGRLVFDNLQVFAASTVLNAGIKTSLDEKGIYTGYTSGLTTSQWNRFGAFTISEGSTLNLGSDIYFGNTTVNGSLVVNSGGTLDCGSSVSRQLLTIATGLSSVTLNSGASLIVRSPQGISAAGATGNIQTTTRIYNTAANYTYANSSSANYTQITGTGLPTNLTGNLTINNGSNVSLSAATIESSPGILFLTNGKFILGTNSFTADNITGGSALSYVCTNNSGTLNRTVGGANVFFPVGNSTYNPVQLTNSGTTDQYQIKVIDNVTDDGSGVGQTTFLAVVKRTWMISESTIGGSNTTIRLHWNGIGEEINSFTASNAFMAHFVASANLWDNIGGVAVGTGYVETSGNQDFSPFTISSTGVFAPLPTELVSFQANCTEQNASRITWSTASENNSSHFSVERSRDGMNWEVVDIVPAAGASNELLNYSVDDDVSIFGIRYYRLVQFDINGEYKLFDMISLNCEEINSSDPTIKIYPNPGNGNFTVEFVNNEAKGLGSIMLTSIGGQILLTQPVLLSQGSNTFFLSKDVPSGYYIVSIEREGEIITRSAYIRE